MSLTNANKAQCLPDDSTNIDLGDRLQQHRVQTRLKDLQSKLDVLDAALQQRQRIVDVTDRGC
jgi:hypothetical protein